MSRAQLTSTVEQNTGGAVAPVVAGKNAVINGGMDIWQRSTANTSFAVNNSGSYVTADRWKIGSSASVNLASSQQAGDNVGNRYALRYGRVSGQTATGVVRCENIMETVSSIPLAGKTVTLSFYAKKGVDGSFGLTSYIYSATGTDQSSTYNGFTGATYTSQSNAVTTTSTKYTMTATILSNVTQVAVLFDYASTGTAGANEWIQIEGVQLEVGSVATPFSRNAGTIQGELAACQRYYATSIPDGYTVSTFPINAQGQSGCAFYNNTGNDLWGNLMFPVRMRTAPTLTLYSQSNRTAGSLRDANTGSDVAMGTYAPTAGNGSNVTYITATGLTTGRFYSGQWTASAEL